MSMLQCWNEELSSKENSKSSKYNTSIPTIALINGLSGGHKGEKVMSILEKCHVPVFNLLQLSSEDQYFNKFCLKINEIYSDIIVEEMERMKCGETLFRIQPRILIGGGDGTIAWALSILDRAFLNSDMLRILWRRNTLMTGMQETINEIQLPIKRRMSINSFVSNEFYYSNVNTYEKSQSFRHTKTFDFINYDDTNDTNDMNHIDIKLNINVTENITNNSEAFPFINIDLHISDEEAKENYYYDNEESSASMSANNAREVVEDFLNQNLSEYSSPNHKIKYKENKSKDNLTLNTDELSTSLVVTHEELETVKLQKKNVATVHQETTYEELRILQSLYNDNRIGPVIGILPLGTGNDLSRCLGTGTIYPGSDVLQQLLLYEYQQSPITRLDRWKLEFLETNSIKTLKNRPTSEMLCYFSIGFESEISYRFACARKNNPKLFNKPWKNKLRYILSGISTTVEEIFGITKPLNDVIELYVDNKKIKLPSKTRSIVISNIQSMADGVYFWGKSPSTKKDISDFREPRLGDGYLEVMTAKGVYKYLQTRVGMSHYRRLSQSKQVTLITKTSIPVQVDGESWIETPGIINIFLLHQVFAVVGTNEPRGIRII